MTGIVSRVCVAALLLHLCAAPVAGLPWSSTRPAPPLAATQLPPSPQPGPPDCDHWKSGRFDSFLATATADDVTSCLRDGADVHARDDANGTPLHWVASFSNDPGLIAALLAGGADVDARAWDGRTPLHRAAARNANPAIVTALIEAGRGRERAGRQPPHPAAPVPRQH